MLFGFERAGAGYLDDIHPPQAFGAVELDVAAAPAQPLPRRHRQILHPLHADAAEDRHAFRFHETVVRHRRPLEPAEAGVLSGFGFVPVDLIGPVVHGAPILSPASESGRSPDCVIAGASLGTRRKTWGA